MFPIPAKAIDDDRISIVGMSGSGKTYAAMSAVEILLEQKSRVVIVDPLGVWWGLRIQADGKTPAFNLPIFGGAHGDLALTEGTGAVIGETVAAMAESCIVDISQIGTKAGERRFMLAFLTALYRGINGSQVHVVFDEADMWAPQRLLDKDGEAAKLLGMMETVIRRGRVRGFIPWLITQRPAVLSKDVLSQSDGIISFKLTASQDRDAIRAWIEGQADRADEKVFLSSLPKLGRGTGVAWFPARAILQTVTFPVRKTFDSSRAPKRGETRAAAVLTALDLGQLRERLALVEAETRANDPKALRAEIVKLKAELDGNGPDRTALQDAYARGIAYSRDLVMRDVAGCAEPVISAMQKAVEAVQKAVAAVHDAANAAGQFSIWAASVTEPVGPRAAAPTLTQRPAPARSPAPPPAPARPLPAADVDGLTKPQTRVLQSIAFWRESGSNEPTREQVAGAAGYKPGTGNFNNIVGALVGQNRVSIPAPGRLALACEIAPISRETAREQLRGIFEAPQLRVLDAAMEFHAADPRPSRDMTREELAIAAGYAPGTGNFNNIVGSLTSIDVLQRSGPGRVQVSDWAREVLA